MERIKSDKIILNDKLFDGYIYFENGKIAEVTNVELPYDKEYDYTGRFVSAGFIDLHTHGGAGFDFINSEEDVIGASDFHLSHGTTSILPTISAAPISKMRNAVECIANVMKNGKSKANIIGAHMEGPYLSKEQCGAQCSDFITAPDPDEYKELIDAFPGAIARWSYAPENDPDGEFAEFLTKNSIIASAGHTNAIYQDIKTAMNKGMNLITHLYSCTSTVTRDHGFRRLGVIESAYLEDDIFVEIIADGKHLPPDLIKLILKVKGIDKVALVTDSLSLAGTKETSGKMVDTEYIIEDGVCKLKDRSAFAGSIATADVLIRTIHKEVGLSVVDAVYMMTEVPAKILGINKGRLAKEYDADIVVFDENITIESVFVSGKKEV